MRIQTKPKQLAVMLTFAIWSWALAACDHNEPTQAGTSESSTPVSETTAYTVLAEELLAPWTIAFDGELIYITERAGNIVKLEGSELTREPVQLSKSVLAEGEGGLLGFVLAPDFAKSKQAYAYHTYEEKGAVLNRVVRLEKTNSGWTEQAILIDQIPGSFNHNGGRIAIGPDGLLYVTTGDAAEEKLSQNTDILAGKILRMNLDGSIPADNPFPNSYVYSYGHRNPQGLAWTKEGVLYSSEHGPSGTPGGHDEINRIEAGGNYGWPAIIGDQKGKDMITPVYHTGEEAIAPSGIAMTDNDQLLVAALRGQALFSFNIKEKTIKPLLSEVGRVRDVALHDGGIYVITNNTDGRGTPIDLDDRLLLLAK